MAKKKLPCQFPGCKENPITNAQLVLQGTKKIGSVPCCLYHWYILNSGEFCLVPKGDTFQIQGPFQSVAIAESVLAAREATRIQQPKTKKEAEDYLKSKQ